MKNKRASLYISIFMILCTVTLCSITWIQPEAYAFDLPGTLPTVLPTPPPVLLDISGKFTDPNFKQVVWEWLGNTGTPGSFTRDDITARIASGFSGLAAANCGISSLNGIECLEGLLVLTISNNSLTGIPSLPSTLLALECNNCGLTSLPALPESLRELYCYQNQLTALPALPDSLEKLTCASNQLTSLPALPGSLTELLCGNNKISSLPGLPDSITNLFCECNTLTNLPELSAALEILDCHQNQLTGLPGLPQDLLYLYCHDNQLTALPELPPALDTLVCRGNKLSSLPALPNRLTFFECGGNQLYVLPALPDSLTRLECSNIGMKSLPELPDGLLELYCPNNRLSDLSVPDGIRHGDFSYNYLNTFEAPLKTLFNQHASLQHSPQYALKYTGSVLQLGVGESRTLGVNDIRRQMSSDGIVWGDVGNVDFSELTFTSTNNGVAKVDTTGVVTATGEGTCDIIAIIYGSDTKFTKAVIPITCVKIEKAYGEASAYAVPFLDRASEMGIITPRLKGQSMITAVTREEFAELAVQFYEKVTGNEAPLPDNKTFLDCNNPEVLKAYALNITAGVGDGTKFEPDTILSRQQMATMITKTLKACYPNIVFDIANQPNFRDQGKFAAYAVNPAKFMARYSITVGDGNGSFDPIGVCYRQQAIIFLVKSYDCRDDYIYE